MYFDYENYDEIVELSLTQARFFAANKRDISLGGLKHLPLDIATELSRHSAALALNGLVTISIEVASALANHPGALELNGLTECAVSPKVAKALSRHVGFLSLNGLTDIRQETASWLGEHCGTLVVDGLRTLTNKRLAEKLFGQRHKSLKWYNESVDVEVLSPHAAGILVQRHTYSFFLPKLRSMNADLARALAKHGGLLGLNGLMELTDGSAYELSGFRGETLELNGLKSMTHASVAAMAEFRGSLYLDGLEMISDEDATALGRRAYRDVEESSEELVLSLGGLKSLRLGQAEGLAACSGQLHLNGIKEVSPEVLEALLARGAVVQLHGLKSVSKELGQALGSITSGFVDVPWKAEMTHQTRTMLETAYNVNLHE